MATEPPCREASQELARELLISISDSQPEKAMNADALPESSKGENGAPVANGSTLTNCDGAEKYRSELISISYSQSPDVAVLPVASP